MKLLLTSNGLSNESIAKALQELVGKEPSETKIAFIPTAALCDRNNKGWLINDLHRIHQKGYYVDIIELNASRTEPIADVLAPFDVIFVGGGNTFYLSYWLQKSGLYDALPELLKDKVYAGISAGSIVTGASMVLTSQALEDPDVLRDEHYTDIGPNGESSAKTLHLVDFIFRPHYNSPDFPLVNKENLTEKSRHVQTSVYALDDNSALKIIDEDVEVISEGEWLKLD